jgi:hypothetical protein
LPLPLQLFWRFRKYLARALFFPYLDPLSGEEFLLLQWYLNSV